MFVLCFEAVSGMRVNLAKSSLILVGGVENIQLLAWKSKCLSKGGGGRLTLIGSALSSIRTYSVFLFLIPSLGAAKLEAIQSNYGTLLGVISSIIL